MLRNGNGGPMVEVEAVEEVVEVVAMSSGEDGGPRAMVSMEVQLVYCELN
jgi:hypothetical protein